MEQVSGLGIVGVMLQISYKQLGRQIEAEEMRHLFISEKCPVDAGNGLAKTWAARH